MLEKPDLPDESLIDCLASEFGLQVVHLAFLPLGADQDTAVYRAVGTTGEAYFVKLRRGEFNPASVAVPEYLHAQGLRQVIPPLPTQTGQLWASLGPYNIILYPFVEGEHGFARKLTERQWIEFGAALKKFHATDFPASITRGIPRESFSAGWREAVKLFLERVEQGTFEEPAAAEMAAFLKAKQVETLALVQRAERLARVVKAHPPEFILCHADIHAWNLLVVDAESFYIVDWDTLIFAPRERDLMFVGAGLGGNGQPPEREEALFYQGYGPTQVDRIARAYYRYERIVEDIAVFCEQILNTAEGGEDRIQSLEFLKSNYLPGGVIEMARRSDEG